MQRNEFFPRIERVKGYIFPSAKVTKQGRLKIEIFSAVFNFFAGHLSVYPPAFVVYPPAFANYSIAGIQ